jgi:hypothetical protein
MMEKKIVVSEVLFIYSGLPFHKVAYSRGVIPSEMF